MSFKTLLRVPLISALGGIAAHYAVILLLGRFALLTLPDGSISISPARQFILYLAIFLAVLFTGGRFLRSLTRREALLSAALTSAYGLILILVQRAFGLTTGAPALVMFWLHMPFQWCNVFSLLIFPAVGGEAGAYLGAAAGALAPLLFVFFGRKRYSGGCEPPSTPAENYFPGHNSRDGGGAP